MALLCSTSENGERGGNFREGGREVDKAVTLRVYGVQGSE